MLFLAAGLLLIVASIVTLNGGVSEYVTIRREWWVNILVMTGLVFSYIGLFLGEL